MSLTPTLRLRWSRHSTTRADLTEQSVPAHVSPVRFDPATRDYIGPLVYLQQCFLDESGVEAWFDIPVAKE